MATTAVLPKDVAVPEASAEDCIMVDDEEESAGSPSTKAAPTKTPTTVQGGKKRKPAAKAPPAPIGRGIAAFMMPASSKKAKTENSASPAPKGAASAAMEEDSPDAEAPPAEEDEDATLAPSQMEKALNEVADARSDANDAKAASASASPAKSQSPAKVAAAKSEEQPAATPAKEEEHPAPSSAEKAEGAVKDTAQEGGDDVMVVDDDSGDAEQGGVKQDKDASPAKSPAKPAEQGTPSAGATQSTTPPKLTKAEKAKRIEDLTVELSGLAKVKVGGESVATLRPTPQEVGEELECAAVKVEGDQPLSLKTRAIIARFIDGSHASLPALAAGLLESASNKPEDTAECLTHLEAAIAAVGEQIDAHPDVAECKSGAFVRRWKVRDMADIPEMCRQLVDTHRKMQAAISDRMVCIQNIISSDTGKAFSKFERQLVVIKDKYKKLEEKEGKEKERLEAKLEALRKKQAEKEEKQQKKDEDKRLKEEGLASKTEMQVEKEAEKEAQKAEKEAQKADKEAQKAEKEEKKADKEAQKAEKDEQVKKEKETQALLKQTEKDENTKKKAQEKEKKDMAKKGVTVGQASFMSNFLKKSSTTSPDAKPSSTPAGASSASSSSKAPAAASTTKPASASSLLSFVSPEKKPASNKPRSNFHAWEKPKAAIVAGFPYGPDFGEPRAPATLPPAPETPDLASWLSVWRSGPKRVRPSRPMRSEDKEHGAMRVFQLHMNVPKTVIQLVDVDVDASQKVMWDIEDEEAEEKLKEIMSEAKTDDEGILTYRGRQYEVRTEGGGWFETRRPGYCGTFSKTSAVVSGRNPFAQDAELDYSYESDADWESEVGEGEDLGSDLDEEEEEEDMEDEERGFVVPDGQSDDGPAVAPVKRLKKLEQVVHYAPAAPLPMDIEKTFAVQVLDSLPMLLSADPGTVLEENMDFFGDDLGSAKAPTLESAIYAVHKHPTACSFTWVIPDAGSKYGGYVFLKGVEGPKGKSEQGGMVSGYIVEVPKMKRMAMLNLEKEDAAALAAAQAVAVKAGGCASAKGPKKDIKDENFEHVEVAQKEAEKAKKEEQAKKKKIIKKDSIPDAHLLEVVKIVHGSTKAKVDLVKEFQAKFPEVAKSKVEKYMSTCASKKGTRWNLNEECLAFSPFIAEIAKDVWKQRVQADKPEEPATGVQLQLAFRPQA